MLMGTSLRNFPGKLTLAIASLTVAVLTALLVFALNQSRNSYSDHLSSMINLCAEEILKYGKVHSIVQLEHNPYCELLSDDELMTLYNTESSDFRMDCISDRSQVYTLEGQRCVVYQSASPLED